MPVVVVVVLLIPGVADLEMHEAPLRDVVGLVHVSHAPTR